MCHVHTKHFPKTGPKFLLGVSTCYAQVFVVQLSAILLHNFNTLDIINNCPLITYIILAYIDFAASYNIFQIWENYIYIYIVGKV